jgi:hypothetical protein
VIDFPGAKGTQIWSINDSGQMAGFYLDPNRPMPEFQAAADSTSAVQAAAAADSTSPMAMLADLWGGPAGVIARRALVADDDDHAADDGQHRAPLHVGA